MHVHLEYKHKRDSCAICGISGLLTGLYRDELPSSETLILSFWLSDPLIKSISKWSQEYIHSILFLEIKICIY